MSIVILETRVESGAMTGGPDTRAVTLWISDGSVGPMGPTNYITQRGNLPLTGDLLPALVADEAAIWADAVAGGQVATNTENAIVEAIQWYKANGGAKADVFDKSITQLATDITAMVAASFPPPISAAVRTGWVRTLMSSLLDTRVNAHDRDLI